MMASTNRRNALALAVLVSLAERPMHPYEVGTVLRQRAKHESVRMNYGSLYGVVESLEKRGLITPHETVRDGRRPERTVYEITDAGRHEMSDWLAELLSTPAKEYPQFETALSFLPALAPEDAIGQLRLRVQALHLELARSQATRELVQKMRLPRLFWIEDEFRVTQREAELAFVERLVDDIESGALEGLDFWHEVHEHPERVPEWRPPDDGD
jgi:DNA-binding PadR family transcriptional regulator